MLGMIEIQKARADVDGELGLAASAPDSQLPRAPAPGSWRWEFPLLRIERHYIRGEVDDVGFRQRRNRLLHQRRVGAVAQPFLEDDELPRDVNRVQPRDARHVTEPLQSVAVAERAGDGLP